MSTPAVDPICGAGIDGIQNTNWNCRRYGFNVHNSHDGGSTNNEATWDRQLTRGGKFMGSGWLCNDGTYSRCELNERRSGATAL